MTKVTPVFIKSLFDVETNELTQFSQEIKKGSQHRLKECYLVTEDKKVVAYGATLLSPKDKHSGKLSSDISLGRALCAFHKKKTQVSIQFPVVLYTNEIDSVVNDKVETFLKSMKLPGKNFFII